MILLRINLFNIDEFVELNKLKEVKSAVLFQRGDTPHPEGLLSNEIFGVNVKERKENFAYINLNCPFMNPIIYIQYKRIYRKIEKIVNGEFYFSVNSKGEIVEDQVNGDSGIEWLYKNWEKINFKPNPDDSDFKKESLKLIGGTPKNQVFMTKMIVVPVFYRDVTSTKKGGEDNKLNPLYANLIRMASLLKTTDMFGFQFFKTQYNMQSTIVAIYDYFKTKIDKKNGLIRKYLLGKSTDYTVRAVITAPTFHSERPEDMFTDIGHAVVPISMCCSGVMPFVVAWVKKFFENNIIDNKNGLPAYDPRTGATSMVEPKDPESYFTEEFCKKGISRFISDPSSRFDVIKFPTVDGKMRSIIYTGKKTQGYSDEELSTISFRPMTWTDLLYLACSEVTKDKYCIVTRYPVSDEFGVFIAKVRVGSTTETDVVMANGVLYKWYPHVEVGLDKERVPERFIDSMQFSNSYLKGLDGDYDGDQITCKILWTKEANEDCAKMVNRKSYFVNISGSNTRVIGSEAIQTLYMMTKDPDTKYKAVPDLLKKELLGMDPKDITFTKLVELIGNTRNGEHGNMTKSNYHSQSPLTLKPKEWDGNTTEIHTSLGRLLYNKIICERCKLQNILGYVNDVITDKYNSKLESKLSSAFMSDDMTVDQMKTYINTRDWLGLQLHPIVTVSFTPGTLKVPPSILALKKKLIAENKEALEAGDVHVSEKIEKILLDETKKVLKDDPGLDLYLSGARGSFNNNFKNIFLIRGPVKNPYTGKFDIITNSLVDGLDKKDLAAQSNSILCGAYAKTVSTADTGYLGKQLMQLMQSETLGPDGSDCHTTKTIDVLLTQSNLWRYSGRYIIDAGKLVCLTDDVAPKYFGKVVKMRSVLYCTLNKGRNVCEKCAGRTPYTLEKTNIGLTCFRISTTCTNLNMKKFHDATVHTHTIDPNSILV